MACELSYPLCHHPQLAALFSLLSKLALHILCTHTPCRLLVLPIAKTHSGCLHVPHCTEDTYSYMQAPAWSSILWVAGNNRSMVIAPCRAPRQGEPLSPDLCAAIHHPQDYNPPAASFSPSHQRLPQPICLERSSLLHLTLGCGNQPAASGLLLQPAC